MRLRQISLILFVFAVSIVSSAQSSGKTFIVNTTADTIDASVGDGICADSSGDCSLRAALMEANFNTTQDTVSLPAGTFISTLTTGTDDQTYGDFDVLNPLTIIGVNAAQTIVSSGIEGERVFEVAYTGSDIWSYTDFHNIAISGGSPTDGIDVNDALGGGIYADIQALLIINESEIRDNSADTGGGLVVTGGTVVITRSSITENTASDSCGGIYIFDSPEQLWIEDSTFSGNTSASDGGAICLVQNQLTLVTITHSTIAYNHAGSFGGGITSQDGGDLAIVNSILVGNTSGEPGTENCAVDPDEVMLSAGNLFDLGGCGDPYSSDTIISEDDIVTSTPHIAPLGLKTPGYTRVHALFDGSPAINTAMLDVCTGADQRGIERPQEFACDIGAYEIEAGEPATFAVDTTADTLDANRGDGICADSGGDCSLRAALMESNSRGSEDTILLPAGTYTSTLTTGTLDDTFGDFDITQPVKIQGAGADTTVISSGIAGTRVIEISGMPGAGGCCGEIGTYLEYLSISDGSTLENGGGIYVDIGQNLYLKEIEIRNNAAALGGGVYVNNSNIVWIERSAITENTASGSCGGAYIGDLTYYYSISNSTFSGNEAETGEGGGICLNDTSEETSNVFWSVTVADNHAATVGGGLVSHTGELSIVLSVFADNTAGISGTNCELLGTPIGYSAINLFENGDCDLIGEDNIVTTDAMLAPLALNAPGKTRTHTLLIGSPAMDAAYFVHCYADSDQRGVPRSQGANCDLGAYETVSTTPGISMGKIYESDPTTLSEDGFPVFPGTLIIQLQSEPSGTVVIDFSDANGDLEFDPAQVTFTPENWYFGQSIEVSAVDDAIIEGEEFAVPVLTISGTASEYASAPYSTITFTITDNDTGSAGLSVTPSESPLMVSEAGDTSSFELAISSQPSSPVTVTVSEASGEISFNQTEVVFNASNWSTPVTVTVGAVHDGDIEGTQSTDITFVVSTAAPEYSGATLANLPVSIEDDDSATLSITSAAPPLAVSEAGTTAAFDLALSHLPTGDVTVTFGGLGADLSVSVPSVTFNAGNWDTPVTVTVSAVDDAEAEDTENSAITFTVTGAAEYAGITVPTLAVSITDNEIAALSITSAAPPLAVSEAGTTATFDLALSHLPTGDVTVTFGGLGADLSVSVPSVTFTIGNWNTPVTVTVSAIDDTEAEGTESGAITYTVTGAVPYAGITVPALAVSITDNDALVTELELLDDGGFEAGTAGEWFRSSNKAKRKCGALGSASDCAMQIKPSIAAFQLYQEVDAVEIDFEVSDTLEFTFTAKISGTMKLKPILKLWLESGTKLKLKVTPKPGNTGGAWLLFSLTYAEPALADVTRARVEFNSGQGTGKIWLDDVSLILVETSVLPRTGSADPLPVPPESFRGSN